jgi:tetratricopeptide (TPR) repeat protein
MDSFFNKNHGAVKESRPDPAPVMPAERLETEPQQKSAMNALTQAQNLWRSGSHVPAVELLREALAVVERSAKPSGNNSELASLARELARMELADGRTGQTLALLTRLEPLLSGFADIWAIRGNAAQRLGRHEESAAAYLMALELRPDEPRWMLGAAVSLAAYGKTVSAAEFAEKARTAGVLSPDVASYLRQLGVSLREH